jgi:hypothetical protein
MRAQRANLMQLRKMCDRRTAGAADSRKNTKMVSVAEFPSLRQWWRIEDKHIRGETYSEGVGLEVDGR